MNKDVKSDVWMRSEDIAELAPKSGIRSHSDCRWKISQETTKTCTNTSF